MASFHLAKKITNEILVRHIHLRKVCGNNLLNFSRFFFYSFLAMEPGQVFMVFRHCLGKFKGFENQVGQCPCFKEYHFLLLPKFLTLTRGSSCPLHDSDWGLCDVFLLHLIILQWNRFFMLSFKIITVSDWRELQNNRQSPYKTLISIWNQIERVFLIKTFIFWGWGWIEYLGGGRLRGFD